MTSTGPEIDIAGLVDFGRPYAGNSDRRENHYQAGYTYSRTKGKTPWKAGGAINRVSLRAVRPTVLAASISSALSRIFSREIRLNSARPLAIRTSISR